jgi:hypothetical protein
MFTVSALTLLRYYYVSIIMVESHRIHQISFHPEERKQNSSTCERPAIATLKTDHSVVSGHTGKQQGET